MENYEYDSNEFKNEALDILYTQGIKAYHNFLNSNFRTTPAYQEYLSGKDVICPSMNIYALEGDRVRFSNENAGTENDQFLAEHYLQLNDIYTVDYAEVGNSHTNVYLKEVPGFSFNSVIFTDVEE